MASISSIQHCYLGYNVDLWPEDGDDFDYVGCYRIAYGGATVHADRLGGHDTRSAALEAAWKAGQRHIDGIAMAA
jgi:hypothetical protein